MKFKLNPKLTKKYPSLFEAVVVLKGIDNKVDGAEILKLLRDEESKIHKEIKDEELAEYPVIKAWRKAFKAFGSDPKRQAASIDALLRRVKKGDKLPDVNPLVNLYNYLSIKHKLPFGGEDFSGVVGDLELRYCNGDEMFIPILKKENKPPDKGEIAWVDGEGVTCRKLNWQQCDRTKITEKTKEGYFIIDGLGTTKEEVKKAAEELIRLAKKYFGAKGEVYWLDKDNLEVEVDIETKASSDQLSDDSSESKEGLEDTVKDDVDDLVLLKSFQDESLAKCKIQKKVYKAVEKTGYAKFIKQDEVEILNPPQEKFGDFSTNVAMKLAGQVEKNPQVIAENIKASIEEDKMIAKVEVIGGFVNLTLSKGWLMDELQKILDKGDEYGSSKMGEGQKVIVEYSSINIAKPFTIAHLRSTIIGDAAANILGKLGFTIYRDNHIGDWGTQFGKQIYAIKKWSSIEEIDKADNPVKTLVSLYVKFHKEAEKDPELEDKGREWFKKLEEGDTEARMIWKKCIEWSWKKFEEYYDLLGIEFTENNGRGYGESYFEGKMESVIEELETKGLLKESKGAKLVFFEGDKYPPLMIVKKDGATLYSTRDLATDKFRKKKYGEDIIVINEVADAQSLYFQQIFETERMLGWYEIGQRIHLKHGMMRLKEGKMSTRRGEIIWLEDVLNAAIEKVKEIIKENETDFTKKEIREKSEKIGVGALKWNDLKRSPHMNIIFDWDEILSIEGNSGPYLQYTYARAKSILQQAANSSQLPAKADSFNDEEMAILRTLYKFPEVVVDAGINLSPNLVCSYLFDLAQKFNLFYKKHPVLKAKGEKRKTRIAITAASAQVIKNGLNLLGIEVLEKM